LRKDKTGRCRAGRIPTVTLYLIGTGLSMKTGAKWEYGHFCGESFSGCLWPRGRSC
jgi:hypothetical protein